LEGQISRYRRGLSGFAGARRDLKGNLPPLSAVFPDTMAPIVRVADKEHRIEMMRWNIGGIRTTLNRWN
jgi:hypothetical protein